MKKKFKTVIVYVGNVRVCIQTYYLPDQMNIRVNGHEVYNVDKKGLKATAEIWTAEFEGKLPDGPDLS